MGPLEKWLLANAAKLNLQIRVFDNHILALAGIFDIEARIEVFGKKFIGRGTSFDKSIALKKACNESIERFFLRENQFPSSNGMAAHINEALAIEAGTHELIERDLFLCRYLTRTPFSKIDISNNVLQDISTSLYKKGIDLCFYSMGTLNSMQAILCSIDGLKSQMPFGYIFGTSSGEVDAAIECSFLEAYRNFAHYGKGQSITLTEFFAKYFKARIDFTDHGNLALDTEYAKIIKNDFFSNNESHDTSESIDLKLHIEILKLEGTPFENAPVSVVRISSPKLQNLFVGNTIIKKLNETRLKSFCEAYKRDYRLYKLPHPFN